MNWRVALFPLSILYWLVTHVRNFLFDKRISPSTRFEVPTLVIGNLNTGGTGKTPHTEFFLHLFADKKCGVISRGYGRKSRGFLWVEPETSAVQVGDEPLQMKRKFPDRPVAVCEDRVMAVPEFLGEKPETDLLLFDDAFQHRYLNASAYVLLTTCDDPFFSDVVLPVGNLREARKGAQRADVVIVSKCPPGMSSAEMDLMRQKIAKYSAAPVFFSSFLSEAPRTLSGAPMEEARIRAWRNESVFLFSAIAHGAKWALPHLGFFSAKTGQLLYPDHHLFTRHDIALLKKKWIAAGKPVVLTTEKDAMRLVAFLAELADMEVVYFPIRVNIAGAEELKQHLSKKLF